MEKIGIITDSACDLLPQHYDGELVKTLPFQVVFPEQTYKDGVDIDAEETYRRMVARDIPTTSLPDGQDMHDALTYFKDNGFTHIIGIFISTNLSGTYNAFNNIAEEFRDDLIIETIDTKTLTVGEGIMVMLAEKLIKAGHSFRDIVSQVRARRAKINVYFVVDTLEYLIKGGRIGRVSGTIGQLLHIKPIIHVNDDGIYHSVDKVRGKRQALQKIFSIVRDRHILQADACRVYVMHGGNPKECNEVKSLFEALPNVEVPYSGQISPALGVHTGPGLIGVVVEED